MFELFNTVFYQPLFNLLIFIVNWVPYHDIGIAIIILTIFIRVILYPLTRSSIEAQKKLQDIQPKIDELKKTHKDDKEGMAREMMRIYKEHKINPMSSCFPILIQLPFLIAIYTVFRDGLTSQNFEIIYPFINVPDMINPISLGFIDLAAPSIVLAILAGISQFFSTRMLMRKRPQVDTEGSRDEKMAAMMNKQMLYFMPGLTVIIGITLPGGLTLYWFVNTVLMMLQQKMVFGKMEKKATELEVVK